MDSDVLVAVQDDLRVADAVADAPGPVGFAARTAVDVAKRTGDAVTQPGASWTTLRRQLRPRLTQPIGCHTIATK